MLRSPPGSRRAQSPLFHDNDPNCALVGVGTGPGCDACRARTAGSSRLGPYPPPALYPRPARLSASPAAPPRLLKRMPLPTHCSGSVLMGVIKNSGNVRRLSTAGSPSQTTGGTTRTRCSAPPLAHAVALRCRSPRTSSLPVALLAGLSGGFPNNSDSRRRLRRASAVGTAATSRPPREGG